MSVEVDEEHSHPVSQLLLGTATSGRVGERAHKRAHLLSIRASGASWLNYGLNKYIFNDPNTEWNQLIICLILSIQQQPELRGTVGTFRDVLIGFKTQCQSRILWKNINKKRRQGTLYGNSWTPRWCKWLVCVICHRAGAVISCYKGKWAPHSLLSAAMN